MATSHIKVLGESAYRKGSLERLGDARILLDSERFAASIYLAGRGVEAMLRALIWRHDRAIREGRLSLETGHDLRELLSRVRNLGLLSSNTRDVAFAVAVQSIGRKWHNDMRYFSTKTLETAWWRLGIVGKRWTLKQAAVEFFDACAVVIKRGEELCTT